MMIIADIFVDILAYRRFEHTGYFAYTLVKGHSRRKILSR